MALHESGSVTNRKDLYDGFNGRDVRARIVGTSIAGSTTIRLCESRRYRPSTTSALIRRLSKFVSVNAALAIDPPRAR
jgi:hypothetical protein